MLKEITIRPGTDSVLKSLTLRINLVQKKKHFDGHESLLISQKHLNMSFLNCLMPNLFV